MRWNDLFSEWSGFSFIFTNYSQILSPPEEPFPTAVPVQLWTEVSVWLDIINFWSYFVLVAVHWSCCLLKSSGAKPGKDLEDPSCTFSTFAGAHVCLHVLVVTCLMKDFASGSNENERIRILIFLIFLFKYLLFLKENYCNSDAWLHTAYLTNRHNPSHWQNNPILIWSDLPHGSWVLGHANLWMCRFYLASVTFNTFSVFFPTVWVDKQIFG